MKLRSVDAASAATLAALHAEAFDAPWDEAEFTRLLALAPSFAILAEDDAPLGFVLAWAPAGDAEILTLAVAANARRRGVGARLVDAAQSAALARGASAMLLEVAEDNAAARALYARQGFAEVARRRAYYGRADGPADALVLRRALAD